jgi:L-lactate dehydrogenase complex protein LldG
MIEADDLPATISSLLSAHASKSVVVPADLPPFWLSATTATALIDSSTVDTDTLDGVDSVVTAVALAVAETGTVVLDGGPAQGRRAITLIPDHHIAVVGEEQIVADVPDAVRLVRPNAPQTWISGPSATSDIELRRVEGVHGPRHLDIIIVRGPRVVP